MQKVTKIFGGKGDVPLVEIFKGLDFYVKRNEVVGLFSPSGSGKTTFLQIAGLLDSKFSGDIYINGLKSWNLYDKVWQAATILLPLNLRTWSRLTVNKSSSLWFTESEPLTVNEPVNFGFNCLLCISAICHLFFFPIYPPT